MSCCSNATQPITSVKGPGYRSPSEAVKGPRETLLYTVLISTDSSKPDCLVTIDCAPDSATYSRVLHKLEMPHRGDELHHFGWNACSSCCNDASKTRRFIVLPGFKSSRVYIVDTRDDPVRPRIHKTIEPSEIVDKLGLTSPHTVHCLASGEIMISFLGDQNGNPPGGFLLLDENFDVKGKWAEDECRKLTYNYDFWYQPYHNVMISSTWSSPNVFEKGFNPAEVRDKYGHELFVWDWQAGKMLRKIDLGEEGLIPLELRFHHDPKSVHGYVGAALSSSIFHWSKDETVAATGSGDEWKFEKVIQVEPVNVEGWPMPVPGLITDILISMDDRFLYFSDWFHGDVRQYDISEPAKPKLVAQVWCGGLLGLEKNAVSVKGNKLRGGPQMLQLSLDGKRLYVTNSLFSSWDDQFYPEIGKSGSHLIKIDVDNENGGMKLDEGFFVDFSDGPYRAHETRYPGGDCSSDIFLADA